MNIENVAVIGATGKLGQPVTRKLIESDYKIRVLSTQPDIANAIFPNTEIMRANVFVQESLEQSFRGIDAVYLNLSISRDESKDEPHTESDGMSNIISAAKKADVRRILYLSSLVHRYQGMNDFHWWAFEIKEEAIKLLKQSGVPYTIFYPSTFMESFQDGYLQGNKLLLVGESKEPMYFIAGEDYGNQVVNSLRIAEDESYEFVVQGPEAYTLEEAADLFKQNYQGEELKKSNVPMWLIRTLGIFKRDFSYTAKILEALNKYPEKFEAEETWDKLGKPQITLAEYARNFSRGKS